MKKNLLVIQLTLFVLVSRGQVLLNEVYTDPGAGKNEFFELYNRSTQSTPLTLDAYTLVTFFETPTQSGFCVMDLPNLSVNSKGYFVGASASPFNFQGISNSTSVDFSWNSILFTSSNGYVKKWLKQTSNPNDGNPDYDEVVLPADFNDFFQRRTGTGASFTVFLYKDGTLINAVSFGTGGGGGSGILTAIVNMPPLYIDMSGTAPDFWINFSGYGSVPVETAEQDGGSDNGFIRKADGMCDGWTKSSSQVQHTPQQSNGNVDATMGSISATAIIQLGSIQSGSSFIYDVIAAPVGSFPVELQVYKDNGSTNLSLDGTDEYVESNFENVVSDGPFTTNFSPYDMNMLLVVVSNVGCIDKVLYAISTGILDVKLNYFRAETNDRFITLNWNVSDNEFAQSFDVERSSDGKNFTKRSSILATGLKGEQSYRFSESTAPIEKSYYRLKIHSKDGKFIYSSIIKINSKSENSLKVLSNPVKENLQIRFSSSTDQTVAIHIYNVSGQLQSKQKINMSKGDNLITVSLADHCDKGVYVIELNTATEKFSDRFIIQ